MRKKSKKSYNSKSLKTFLIYAYLVLFLILTSLLIKSFFIIQQNKLHDGNIVIAVSENNKIRTVSGIDSKSDEIKVLNIVDLGISVDSLGDIGIVADARIKIKEEVNDEGHREILKKTLFKPRYADTDLTIFDLIRLNISKKIDGYSSVNEITLKGDETEKEEDRIARDLFSDSHIIEEGATIQIINSVDVSGLGQRFERLISNKGGTVVSVANQKKSAHKSVIKYHKGKSYTANKLRRLLDIEIEELTKKSIADIIIIIGEDKQDATIY